MYAGMESGRIKSSRFIWIHILFYIMKSVCVVCTMLYANVHTFMRLVVVIGIEDVSSLLSSVIFFLVEFFSILFLSHTLQFRFRRGFWIRIVIFKFESDYHKLLCSIADLTLVPLNRFFAVQFLCVCVVFFCSSLPFLSIRTKEADIKKLTHTHSHIHINVKMLFR